METIRGAIKISKNPTLHGRVKHIDMRHNYIRDALKDGVVDVTYIPTTEMAADILTKGLCKPKHEFCIGLLGVESIA